MLNSSEPEPMIVSAAWDFQLYHLIKYWMKVLNLLVLFLALVLTSRLTTKEHINLAVMLTIVWGNCGSLHLMFPCSLNYVWLNVSYLKRPMYMGNLLAVGCKRLLISAPMLKKTFINEVNMKNALSLETPQKW